MQFKFETLKAGREKAKEDIFWTIAQSLDSDQKVAGDSLEEKLSDDHVNPENDYLDDAFKLTQFDNLMLVRELELYRQSAALSSEESKLLSVVFSLAGELKYETRELKKIVEGAKIGQIDMDSVLNEIEIMPAPEKLKKVVVEAITKIVNSNSDIK